jgi:hypothetical protein
MQLLTTRLCKLFIFEKTFGLTVLTTFARILNALFFQGRTRLVHFLKPLFFLFSYLMRVAQSVHTTSGLAQALARR